MTTIVVPLDAATQRGEGERAAAWAYVEHHLATHHAAWELWSSVLPGDEWCKARAVGIALTLIDADEVVVVHDADVLVAPVALQAAVAAVATGAAWAIPHGPVHRYDARSTRALLDDDHGRAPTLTRWAYEGIAGGGIVVLRRSVYDDCPLDPRFVGWGCEDQSWGWALATLHGAPWRGQTQLVHLWHPHATGTNFPSRSPRIENERLRRAYRSARGSPETMRAVVDGGK